MPNPPDPIAISTMQATWASVGVGLASALLNAGVLIFLAARTTRETAFARNSRRLSAALAIHQAVERLEYLINRLRRTKQDEDFDREQAELDIEIARRSLSLVSADVSDHQLSVVHTNVARLVTIFSDEIAGAKGLANSDFFEIVKKYKESLRMIDKYLIDVVGGIRGSTATH